MDAAHVVVQPEKVRVLPVGICDSSNPPAPSCLDQIPYNKGLPEFPVVYEQRHDEAFFSQTPHVGRIFVYVWRQSLGNGIPITNQVWWDASKMG